jgi:hypothetical protein
MGSVFLLCTGSLAVSGVYPVLYKSDEAASVLNISEMERSKKVMYAGFFIELK